MIFLNHINNSDVMLASVWNQVGTHRGVHLFDLDHLRATPGSQVLFELIQPASGKRKTVVCDATAEMQRAEKEACHPAARAEGGGNGFRR